MDISVVVPVYGVEKYIEKSLRSLFDQTKTSAVEFIIVNDCTKDSSMTIASNLVADYSHLDIKLINKDTNEGLAAARQTGIDLASGDYILNIDSDDWCEPTMLENLYSVAKNNNSDIVIADYFISYVDREDYLKQNFTPNGIELTQRMFEQTISPSIWSKMLKRSFLVENDIRWVSGIDMGEDFVVCQKLFCSATKISYIEKAFVHYVCNKSSMTHSLSPKHLDDLIAGIDIVEECISILPFRNELLESLLFVKIRIKALSMYMADDVKTISKLVLLYPETDKIIFSNHILSFPQKIAVFLSSKGFVVGCMLLYRSIRVVKRIKNYFNH